MLLHVCCRTVHRQVSRITVHQARLQFFSPSPNISTSCSTNKGINEKSPKQTKQEEPGNWTSVFAAGTAKKRSLNYKNNERQSMKRNVTRVKTNSLSLPMEPLGSDGWSQLKEKSNGNDNYEDLLDLMIGNNTDFEIAKSLLCFIAEKDGDIDYRILVKYLVLCVKQNQGAEVYDLYDIMKMKFQSFDTGASSLFIKGFSKTDHWRQSIAILETMKKIGSASPRNYAECIRAAIEHQESKLAFALYDEMLQNNMAVPEYAIQSLFDASQDLQDDDYRKRLISILRYFRENQLYPGNALMESIKSWFESIPNESWRGNLTKVTNKGHCQACNGQLESIHLTPEEYIILKNAVIDNIIKGEDIFRKTNPQELQTFVQFVNSRPAYDIVVDGLNMAYKFKNKIFSQTLLNIVHCLKKEGKRILVLGRKHMLVPSKKWVKQDIQRLHEYADCFFLDNISSDDPFLIYACINSGNHCCILTQDLLRDHKACLPDAETQRLFFKWQRGHQLVMSNYSFGKVQLGPVQCYDTIVQSTDNSYHIPYDKADVVRTGYEVPNTWLCLKK